VNSVSEPGPGASPQELAEFYDNTDLTSLEPGEPVAVDTSREPMVSRSVRFDRATVERLRAVADTRGVGITQMMRQWILDRLEAEEHGRRQDEIAGELERLARQLRATACSRLFSRPRRPAGAEDHGARQGGIRRWFGEHVRWPPRLVCSGIRWGTSGYPAASRALAGRSTVGRSHAVASRLGPRFGLPIWRDTA
jgi:hypothetical protein